VPRTQLGDFNVQGHPPDGGGVQDVQGGSDSGHDLQDERPDDGGVAVIVPIQHDDNELKTQLDGYHVQELPPDDGRDNEEQFVDAEVGSSFDEEDKYCVTEVLDADNKSGDVDDRFGDTADEFNAGS
jgi:hypothetical protein